jgi:hypothetical protein
LKAFLALISPTLAHPAVRDPTASIATHASDAPDKDRIEAPYNRRIAEPETGPV